MTQNADNLAPYAVREAASRGRANVEPATGDDSPFEVDRYRILTCMAFRRLRHKTQVFVSSAGDHFRTRLTHTLEVESQARRLARLLRLNECLAGAIALAHDLGHPPFGHAGEIVLNELMKDHGGFEHNVQSLRVVDYLEHPYPSFRGLNLSFELRESLIKHRTIFDHPKATDVAEYASLFAVGPRAPLEGQAANLADVIAYTLHDIEDGLVDGALTEEMLSASALWREAASPVRSAHDEAPIASIRRPILDDLARRFHEDAKEESERQIRAAGVTSVDDVRHVSRDLLIFSDRMQARLEELQGLLVTSLYRNHRVVRMDLKAQRLIRELFEAYLAQPRLMPDRYYQRVAKQGAQGVICDYIAGMTDRFCQEEHRRLFAPFHFD